ncbi:Hypothetical predicted protein [Paramuricea clavata]|uniref:Uncharacterized protein n=1 Tax=Paramuricea clavata TaxID=317549 RepID=A0A6S7HXJ6_PARCT|nr:Hypothetical predicted protein [Paramuricea clavata]
MMEHVRVVSEFFNFSLKRFALLVKTIEEMLPESSHKRLINICKTRWVARSLSAFIDVFPAVIRCFEIIRDNINKTWNPESVQKAENVRNEVDTKHDLWFEEAESVAEGVGTLPEKTSIASKQQHRANTPADTPSDYYRRVVTIPFLDHLKSQIKNLLYRR